MSSGFFGRVHALWTLDGIGAIVDSDLARAFADPDARVRATGVRIAESRLASGDEAIFAKVSALADDPHVDVRIQVLQSLRFRDDGAKCVRVTGPHMHEMPST